MYEEYVECVGVECVVHTPPPHTAQGWNVQLVVMCEGKCGVGYMWCGDEVRVSPYPLFPIPLSLRVLQQLRALVALNQSLKKQEQQFKAYCKVIWLP